MKPENKTALFEIVRDKLDRYGRDKVIVAIEQAHAGRPDGVIVDADTMGLFRQYRNSVSASGVQLVDEATS